MRKLVFLMAAALMLMATSAFARTKTQGGAKENSLSIGLAQGTNEYSSGQVTGGYLDPPGIFPELGVTLEYNNKLAADYQLAVGFDYLWGSAKSTPTSAAAPGAPDVKITSASWKIRLGGDRIGSIGDRFTWFLGPGLEYWSGKPKFDNVFVAGSQDGLTTTKWGINGRMGGVMWINPKMGIFGRLGDSVGSAATEEKQSGKNTWYYSNFEAAWGLRFKLGG